MINNTTIQAVATNSVTDVMENTSVHYAVALETASITVSVMSRALPHASKLAPGLARVPAIGLAVAPVVGIMRSMDAERDYCEGKISGNECVARKVGSVTGTAGMMGGSISGAYCGAMLGSVVPDLGRVAGSIVGGLVGWYIGDCGGTAIGEGLIRR